MIHLAAKHVLDEMLSLQQLARACISSVGGGVSEATLVVKTKSLALKYLLKSTRIRLVVGRTKRNKLFYGILIDDDPQSPFTLWSLVEKKNELEAVKRIAAGERFMLAMFNEAVVNTCGGILNVHGPAEKIKALLANVKLAASRESEKAEPEVRARLEEWKATGEGLLVFSSDGNHDWGPNKSLYITNQLQTSELDLSHSNEGGQQEQLAAWITDSLDIKGVFQNPVANENTPRELCDLLLTHDFGTILFESKALSILSRADIPARDKLRDDAAKHIKKALRQLSGACKNLAVGTVVLTEKGEKIEVRRDLPLHCVVIIPDQSLLHGLETNVFVELASFASKTSAFVNIMDPSQLFSLMMDSNNLSSRSRAITPLMAFDYLLIRRFESVIQSRDPSVITLCRFESRSHK